MGELNNPASSLYALEQKLQYKSLWLSNPWTHPNTTAASSPYTANSETHCKIFQCLSPLLVSFQKADENIAKLAIVQPRQKKKNTLTQSLT